MKKIENINLGGQPFTIDQDAFKELDSYINNISRMLKKSRMKSELIDDIEFRISEIISEKKGDNPIVTVAHVDHVKKVMGDPKVFLYDSDYTAEDYKESSNASSGGGQTVRRKKRLFRDVNDKVLGGVASGMAAYFGIHESWIMRLIFVMTFFTIGFNVLLYIILWAIIPAAVTEEDYAEMRGEPINLSDITDSVKSEFEDLKKSF